MTIQRFIIKPILVMLILTAMTLNFMGCNKKESDDSNMNMLLLLNALPKVCSTSVTNPTAIITETPVEFQYNGTAAGYCYFRHSPSTSETFTYTLYSNNVDSNLAVGAQNDENGGGSVDPRTCTGWDGCSIVSGTGSTSFDMWSGFTASESFRIIGVYAPGAGARFTLEAAN